MTTNETQQRQVTLIGEYISEVERLAEEEHRPFANMLGQLIREALSHRAASETSVPERASVK